MQVYVIDENGKEVAVQGSVPQPRPGYKAVAVGAKDGTTVYRYVPETASAFGPPGYSPGMSAPVRAATDSLFTSPSPEVGKAGGAPTSATPEMVAAQSPRARIGMKAKKVREVPTGITGVAGAEAPTSRGMEAAGGGLQRFQEPATPGATSATSPEALPPDPFAKFGGAVGPDQIPAEPPILASAEAGAGSLPSDPIARFRNETKPEPKGGEAPLGGKPGQIDWTGSRGTSSSIENPIINDPESLARYKKVGEEGSAEQKRQYERYLAAMDEADKPSAEQENLKADRGAALDRYTQGLDRSERSKLIDVLANNLGKFAAGYAGMKTGTPVGKYYEYTPTGIPEMQRETAEKKYGAEMGNIAAAEKDIKDKQALKLESRAKAVDFAMTLPAAQQNMLYRILQLQAGRSATGKQDQTNYITADNLQEEMEKRDAKQREQFLQQKHDWLMNQANIESREREGGLNRAAQAAEAEAANRSAERRTAMGIVGGFGRGAAGGPSTTVEKNTVAETAFIQSNAIGGSISNKVFRDSNLYKDAKADGNLEAAKKIYLDTLKGQTRSARPDNQVPQFNQFLNNVSRALPYVNSFDELENIGDTMNKLGQDPDGPFSSTIFKNKTVTKGITPPSTPTPPPAAAPTRNLTRDQVIRELEAKAVDPQVDEATKARIVEKLKKLKGQQ